jgi:hypothetical protein
LILGLDVDAASAVVDEKAMPASETDNANRLQMHWIVANGFVRRQVVNGPGRS